MYIPVIFYHSVAPKKNPKWIKKYLTLELKRFEYQMLFLKENHYETIFLNEYFELLASNKKIPNKKYVCITFDDGFLDNWIYAFPVLQRFGFKATIFVSPGFVDQKARVRKTLNDYWSGKATLKSLEKWGYLSWEELSLMESSGSIDIQSHAMTHSEVFVSDKITAFHHPGSQYLHPIGNLFPERKPYYIEDEGFEKLLPYGHPFFEFASSIVGRIVDINPEFNEAVVRKLKGNNWHSKYVFMDLYKKIEPIYLDFLKRDGIIAKRETEKAYHERLVYELKRSREIIEHKLNKRVNYLCWPFHHYNDHVHMKAKETGYKATVILLRAGEKRPADRFDRTEIESMKKGDHLSILKARIKLNGYHRLFPLNYIYDFRKRGTKDYKKIIEYG